MTYTNRRMRASRDAVLAGNAEFEGVIDRDDDRDPDIVTYQRQRFAVFEDVSMTLLEDARRLRMARDAAENCYECGYYGDIDNPHAAACPYRALPQIVAALEAAECLSAVVSRERFRHTEYVGETVDGRGTYSWCQSCDTPWPCNWSEAAVKNAALLTILRGETAP